MIAYLRVLGCGIATEAVLVGLMMFGGFGPCGPGSPLGMAVLLLHEPGIWVLSLLQLHGEGGVCLAFLLYAGVWSALWYLFWRRRLRRRV